MTSRESRPARVFIGRIKCDAVNYDQALARIRQLTLDERPHLVLTPNIAHVRQAADIPEVAEAYAHASLSTPDGWPLVLALRLLGARAQGRVTGSDLTPLLCREPYRIALVGGKANSAELAAQALMRANPVLQVALVEAATAEELADDTLQSALLDRIRDSDADLIFLGIGVPKQERLALSLLRELPRGVILCVGATIEFVAATTSRSPQWIRSIHVEWLYRLLLEPRRLYRRYMRAAPYFVQQLLKARIELTARNRGARLGREQAP